MYMHKHKLILAQHAALGKMFAMFPNILHFMCDNCVSNGHKLISNGLMV